MQSLGRVAGTLFVALFAGARAALLDPPEPSAGGGWELAIVLGLFSLFSLTFALCLRGFKKLAEARPKAVLARPAPSSRSADTVIHF